MKNLTVLAAAMAAGMMIFAAFSLEETKQAAVTQVPRAGASTKGKTDRERDAVQPPPALTAEQFFDSVEPVEVAAVASASLEDRYRPLVEKYASENGVPVDLAHAVISVESNYKPNSLGRAGEVGLMQIKPATAKMMGYTGTKKGLFDPETNIKYGMKYLGKAQKLGDGTTCGTILKYNAGHAAKRMNPTSRKYCEKVKQHLADNVMSAGLSAEPGSERGA